MLTWLLQLWLLVIYESHLGNVCNQRLAAYVGDVYSVRKPAELHALIGFVAKPSRVADQCKFISYVNLRRRLLAQWIKTTITKHSLKRFKIKSCDIKTFVLAYGFNRIKDDRWISVKTKKHS